MKEVQEFLEELTAAPDSWDNYFHLGRWLIWKRLPLIWLALLLAAAGAVTAWVLLRPQIPPVFERTDEALAAYSGEAILTVQGSVVYRGQVAQGMRDGVGREIAVIDERETTVYEGLFMLDRYHGQGRLYERGQPVYEGQFQNGKYDGVGTLYSAQAVCYEGQFASGLYEGQGVLYEKDAKRYEGGFSRGRYDGSGTLYADTGQTVYAGGFRQGLYGGQGILYDANGVKMYEGAFEAGLYEGEGTLYAEARLRYVGAFRAGTAGPFGSLYNLQGQCLYTGPVYHGEVDYVALSGISLAELQTYTHEVPDLYYRGGEAGLVYKELGFAAVGRYDYMSYGTPQAPASVEQDAAALVKPGEDVLFDGLIVQGARAAGRIPQDAVEILEREGTAFEWFIASRVAGIDDPVVSARYPAQVAQRGARLYEVLSLPKPDDLLTGVYENLIAYLWPKGESQKGAMPTLWIRKARLGG